MLLGTNYGFTVATPAGGSVLDFLGPWPWYLLWMQVPALALMYLLTLPFRRYPRGRTGSSCSAIERESFFPAPPLPTESPQNGPPASGKKSPGKFFIV